MFEITSNSKLWETKLKQLNANLESLLHATNQLGSLDSVFAAGIALPKPPKAQQIRGAIVRNNLGALAELLASGRLLCFAQPENAIQAMSSGIRDLSQQVGALSQQMEQVLLILRSLQHPPNQQTPPTQ